MRLRLRTRFAIAAMVVLAVVAAAGWHLPRTVRDAQLDEVDRQLSAMLPIAGLVAAPRAVRQAPPPAEVLSDIYIARITDGERNEIVSSQAAPNRSPADPAESTPFPEDPHPETIASTEGSGRWRAALIDTNAGDQLLVAIPLDRVDATVDRTRNTVIAAGTAIVLATAISGWWLLRLGLRPVAELTSVATAIARGERARRARTDRRGTEAAELAHAFNIMLDEQQATEARLRQFVADASHELRTPVAAIAGFADLWRHGSIGDAELHDVMRRIGQEASRMRGLVEDLLLLARLDEGRAAERAPVDLAVLAADARLDASATHPNRTVLVDAPAAAVVSGDENQLRQVFTNLVANSLTHAGAARVTIRIRNDGMSVAVTVVDDGAGMSPDAVARAFDRFWRADSARSTTGTGLGLAIVKSVIEAHGGTVTLRSRIGRGTEVEVRLPSCLEEPRRFRTGVSEVRPV